MDARMDSQSIDRWTIAWPVNASIDLLTRDRMVGRAIDRSIDARPHGRSNNRSMHNRWSVYQVTHGIERPRKRMAVDRTWVDGEPALDHAHACLIDRCTPHAQSINKPTHGPHADEIDRNSTSGMRVDRCTCSALSDQNAHFEQHVNGVVHWAGWC